MSARSPLRRQLLRPARRALLLAFAAIILVELLGAYTYVATLAGRVPVTATSVVAVAAWARLLLEIVVPFLLLGLVYLVLSRTSREITASLADTRAVVERLTGGGYDRRAPESPIRELHDLSATVNQLAEQLTGQTTSEASPAFRDGLTGLPNRTLFVDRLERALARAFRHDHLLAVLVVNLDDFGRINDNLGYHVGDQVLAAAAERLGGCIRHDDTAARLEGDEFAALAEHVERPADATLIAQRILQQFGAPFSLSGQLIFVSASIGVAVAGSQREEPEYLLRNAHLAMSHAKATGKARYTVYQRSLRSQAAEQLKSEAELLGALETDRLAVYYQPVVDLRTGEITDIEARAGWAHPSRGPAAPDGLIDAAGGGLIAPIADWLLREACRQVQAWRAQVPSTLSRVSMDLPARHLTRESMLADLQGVLTETGLPAEALRLEITEGHALRDKPDALAVLHALKQMGIALALDDFGVGDSSLADLKWLPIDSLKIDRLLVQRATHDPEDAAILRAIVSVAGTLKLAVVADGVENTHQMDTIRSMGCDRGQGNYFFRPLRADQMQQVLAAGARWKPAGRAIPDRP